MRRIAFLGIVLLLGCFGPRAETPEDEARAILERAAGDEEAARAAWRADPARWRLGLEHEVATRDPVAPATVRTERELVTPGLADCGAGAGPLGYRTDVLDPAGRVLARFRWPSLDGATAGHGRVRAAAADARGEAEALWSKVAADPVLDAACAGLRGHRDRCLAPVD